MSSAVTLIDLRTGEEISQEHQKSAQMSFTVALGNFDGVHAAHRALLDCAVRDAKARKTYAAAFFFQPPSWTFLLRDEQVGLLTTLQEKCALFLQCGVTHAFLADFPGLRDMPASDFIHRILDERCAARAVCCGYDFRFGCNGSGRAEDLSAHYADRCTVLPCLSLTDKGEIVSDSDGRYPRISSRAIRQSLTHGELALATSMLQTPFFLTAPVIYGKQLGRTLGLPTANQAFPPDKLVPRKGVYATAFVLDGRTYYGVSNVGNRPTVEDAQKSQVNCETHLLDFNGDLYGRQASVYFLHFLREEMQFSDLQSLKNAIQTDIQNARSFFASSNAEKLLTALSTKLPKGD